VIALLLVLALVGLLGLAAALLGLVFLGRNAGFNRRAVSVTGVVVGSREHYSTSRAIHRRVWFPRVRYRSGERDHEADAPGEDAEPALGREVPLLVDPTRPEQVSFTGPRGGAGVAWGLTGAGCVFLLLGAGGVAALVALFTLGS
jgi:hypothetical protein